MEPACTHCGFRSSRYRSPGRFQDPDIDAVVIGEGVQAFRGIVRRAEKGESVSGIAGVAVPSDGGPAAITPKTATDLDAIPFPLRSLTVAYRNHYYCDWMKPLASIRTSKGCPYRCNFCAEWKTAGGRYLRRTPERVVEELAGIREECVFFADDESLVDVSRMAHQTLQIEVVSEKRQ